MYGFCKQCRYCREENGLTFGDVMKKIGKNKHESIYSRRFRCRVNLPSSELAPDVLLGSAADIHCERWLWPGLNIDDLKSGLCGCDMFEPEGSMIEDECHA